MNLRMPRTRGATCTLAPVLAALCTLAPSPSKAAEFYYYPTAWYTTTGWSDAVYYPTSLYVPTTYTTSAYWPTSYYVPSSYYVPTTYYTPTSYYVPTTYYRTGLFGRVRQRPIYSATRYVYDLTHTVYTSYVPTSWAVPLSATSYVGDPCDVVGTGSGVSPTRSTSGTANTGQNDSAGSTARPPRAVQSQPQNGSGSPPNGNSGNDLDEPGFDRPRNAIPDDGGTGGNLGLNNTGDSSAQRSAMRPAPTVMTRQPSATAPNALHGEVLSAVDGKPRGNTKVVFADARQTYRDREKTTDTQGRFEVVLPNGDWTVNVEDNTGKLVPYGTITSAGGRFYDDTDRVISQLRLNQ